MPNNTNNGFFNALITFHKNPNISFNKLNIFPYFSLFLGAKNHAQANLRRGFRAFYLNFSRKFTLFLLRLSLILHKRFLNGTCQYICHQIKTVFIGM